MAAIPGGVKIAGPVAPTDSSDSYPSHLASYGKGGARSVATFSEMIGIPLARREQGMIVYVISTNTYYHCTNPTNNTYEVLVLGTRADRIWYDTMPVIKWAYPLTSVMWNNLAYRYAPHMLDGQAYTYPRMKFRVETSAESWDDLSFASQAALIAWINSNVPHDATQFSDQFLVRMYDEIDPTIPSVYKMRGMNRLFSGLIGKHRYRNTATYEMSNCAWQFGVFVTFEMIKELLPAEAHFGLDYASWQALGGMRQVWTGGREENRYALPKGNTTVTITLSGPGQNNRHTTNPNWEGVTPAPIGPYKLSEPRVLVIRRLGQNVKTPQHWANDGDFGIFNPVYNRSHRRSLRCELSDGTTSAAVFYKIQGWQNPPPEPSDSEYALYVKPLGIDQVLVNWYDTSAYELEAVFSNRLRVPIFGPVDTSCVLRSDRPSDTVVLNKSAWLRKPLKDATMKDKAFLQEWEVRFRLRNKTTKKVGPLSCSKIVARTGEIKSCMKWLVEPAE